MGKSMIQRIQDFLKIKPAVLIVEDNKYSSEIALEQAREVFGPETVLLHAPDLASAERHLTGNVSCVATDCYFPYKTGESDKRIGDTICTRVASSFIGHNLTYANDQGYEITLSMSPEKAIQFTRRVYGSLKKRTLAMYELLLQLKYRCSPDSEGQSLELDNLAELIEKDLAKAVLNLYFIKCDIEGKPLTECSDPKIQRYDPNDPKVQMFLQLYQQMKEDRRADPDKMSMHYLFYFADDSSAYYSAGKLGMALADLVYVLATDCPQDQPLGVEVYDTCKKRGIPVVMITGHHAAGGKAVPLFAHYFQKKYESCILGGDFDSSTANDSADLYCVYKNPPSPDMNPELQANTHNKVKANWRQVLIALKEKM